MKIQAYKIDNFIKTSLAESQACLLYGPDAGLVAERKKEITAKIIGEKPDPFLKSVILAKNIQEGNVNLQDELNAISLIPGRRIIIIDDAANVISPQIKEALENSKSNNFLLVVAKELAAGSKLRSLFEYHKTAAALPCYADDAQAIAQIVAKELIAAGYKFSADIPQYFAANFAGNRMIIKSELEKLKLYLGDRKEVTQNDLEEIICFSKEQNFQEIANFVANLDALNTDKSVRRHLTHGVYPITIIRVLINYFMRLKEVTNLLENGNNFNDAIKGLKPPVFFKQKDLMQQHVSKWNSKLITKALELLQDVEVKCKSNSKLPVEIILSDFLLKLIYNFSAKIR